MELSSLSNALPSVNTDANSTAQAETQPNVAAAASDSNHQQCAHCSMAAHHTCKGCADSPDIGYGTPSKTFYCNPTCQKADWSKHRPTCNRLSVRKQLYRAGKILQQIFYGYREVVFEKLIDKVEREGVNLHCYEGQYLWRILVPFPPNLFPEQQDKYAMLTYKACNDAFAFMHSMIKAFFRDICVQTTEIMLHLKEPPRVYVDDDFSNCATKSRPTHEILKLDTKNGESYVLDLTGAQYGFPETIVPYAEYMVTRVKSVDAYHPLGSTVKILHDEFLNADPDLGHKIWTYNVRFTGEMNASMEHWRKHIGNLTLSAMLKLPQKDFEVKRADLIDHILADLRWLKDRYAMRGGLFQEIPRFLVKSEAEIASLEELEIQRMKTKYGEKKFRMRSPLVIEGR